MSSLYAAACLTSGFKPELSPAAGAVRKRVGSMRTKLLRRVPNIAISGLVAFEKCGQQVGRPRSSAVLILRATMVL
jgi:hypothetical protein